MSHNLVFNSITKKYEFMSRGAAWHNLGQVVEDAQTWEQTMKLAGLEWGVSKVQQPHALIPGKLVDSYGIYRDDNKAFLGAVGAQYTPIQNKDQFKFVDDLLDREGGAHYESAGALGNGERVFCLASLADAFEVVPGDRHENYLLFVNAHNSGMSARVFLTSVRVVCANTLAQALSEGERSNKLQQNMVKIRHTKSAVDKMEMAKNVITTAKDGVARLAEKLQVLAGRQMTRESYDEVVARLFPEPKGKEGKEAAAAAVTRRETVLADILKLFESNDGDEFKIIRGTAYNYLNAITEYVDHNRSVRQTDKRDGWSAEALRANAALFGSGAELKHQALDTILNVTRANPVADFRKKLFTGSGKQFEPSNN